MVKCRTFSSIFRIGDICNYLMLARGKRVSIVLCYLVKNALMRIETEDLLYNPPPHTLLTFHAVCIVFTSLNIISNDDFLKMTSISEVPSYRAQANSRMIVFRLYSPLCNIPTMTVTVDGRLITINCHPFTIRMKLPRIFIPAIVEEIYNEELEFCDVIIVRNQGNYIFLNGDSVLQKFEESIEATWFDGETVVPTTIEKRKPTPYGFMNKYFNKFGLLNTEYGNLIDLTDPDNTTREVRRRLRKYQENALFSYFHYSHNLRLHYTVPSIFTYVPPWVLPRDFDMLTNAEESVLYVTRSYDLNVRYPHIYNFRMAKFHLLDVLLAYCYSKRVFQDSNMYSSAWTIVKLASTLSWFETYYNMRDLLRVFYKRSVTYPIHRNWDLTNLVRNDVAQLLRSGPVAVVRAVIEVRDIFHKVPHYYIFNTLYVNHLLHFAKYLTYEQLNGIAWSMDATLIQKRDVRRDLTVIETMNEAIGFRAIEPAIRYQEYLDKSFRNDVTTGRSI